MYNQPNCTLIFGINRFHPKNKRLFEPNVSKINMLYPISNLFYWFKIRSIKEDSIIKQNLIHIAKTMYPIFFLENIWKVTYNRSPYGLKWKTLGIFIFLVLSFWKDELGGLLPSPNKNSFNWLPDKNQS